MLRQEMRWNSGGHAAMILAAVPYAIAQAALDFPAPSVFALIGLLIAVPIAAAAAIIARKSEKGSFKRGFATWSAAVHSVFAVVFAVMALR